MKYQAELCDKGLADSPSNTAIDLEVDDRKSRKQLENSGFAEIDLPHLQEVSGLEAKLTARDKGSPNTLRRVYSFIALGIKLKPTIMS